MTDEKLKEEEKIIPVVEPDTEEEQKEIDLIDDEEFREQAKEALMSIGLPEDEAEMQIEDMF